MEVEGVGSMFKRNHVPEHGRSCPRGDTCLGPTSSSRSLEPGRSQDSWETSSSNRGQPNSHISFFISSALGRDSAAERQGKDPWATAWTLGYLPQESNTWSNLSSSHCSTARSLHSAALAVSLAASFECGRPLHLHGQRDGHRSEGLRTSLQMSLAGEMS